MKKFLIRLAVVLFFILLLSLIFAVPTRATPESRMLTLMNNWRVDHDLHKVRMNAGLRDAAEAWTMHLIVTDTFTHGNMGARLAEYYPKKGYDTWAVGEILTYQTVGYPRKALRAWLRSPGHRQILATKRWRDVGIDRRFGLFNGWFVYMWCVDFGRRTK